MDPTLGGDAVTIIQSWDQTILYIVWTALLARFGWAIKWIFRTRESRQALHSAIASGIDLISDRLAAEVLRLDLDAKVDQFIEDVLAYVLRSVPDSIKFLLPKSTEASIKAWLTTMIRSKLNERAVEYSMKAKAALNVDSMTAAMQAAGELRATAPVDALPDPKVMGTI